MVDWLAHHIQSSIMIYKLTPTINKGYSIFKGWDWKIICNAGIGVSNNSKLWGKGVSECCSKCNIEFKMYTLGQNIWIAVVGTFEKT